MTQKLSEGEVITVLFSENVGQLLDNIKRFYPGALDNAHMIGIIGRGIWGIKGCNHEEIPLSKGERVQFF